jgi:hypothetical protein
LIQWTIDHKVMPNVEASADPAIAKAPPIGLQATALRILRFLVTSGLKSSETVQSRQMAPVRPPANKAALER